MRQFFETGGQGFILLLMAYVGFILGVLVDAAAFIRGRKGGWPQALLDCAACFGAGTAMAMVLILTGQSSLRLYGLLGIAVGWLLYDLGLRSVFLLIYRRVKKFVRKTKSEGVEASKANTYRNTFSGWGKKP